MRFAIVDTPIDIPALRRLVDAPDQGAILIFEGVARNHFEGRPVLALEYEAYPALALPVLEAIGAEVASRWPGVGLAIHHRTGRLAIGEPSVVIAVGAAHRPAAYEASRHALEVLKERLPVWKKEIYDDGEAWKQNAP